MQFQWLFLIFAGIFGGIFAGMGMGGGTVLIPVLTLILGLSQKLSQAINLIVFLPISLVVLIVYIKKGMVEKKIWWIISLPASVVAVVISFFVPRISSKLLQVFFGVFLILISIVQFVILLKNRHKKHNIA